MHKVHRAAGDGRQRKHDVEGWPVARFARQVAPQPQELLQRIGGGAGQDRNRKEARADDADREDDEGEGPGEWLQRGGRLRGCLDAGLPVGMEDGGRGQDDEVHHQVGERHADENVGPGRSKLGQPEAAPPDQRLGRAGRPQLVNLG